jgi:hypothetical protein
VISQIAMEIFSTADTITALAGTAVKRPPHKKL